MNIDEIIRQLSIFVEGELPKDALLAAQENWSQILPSIHTLMEKFIADPSSIDDEESYFIFMGVWLLAQQKEFQSLPLLIKVCDREDDFESQLEYLFGDSLTESLPSFFYILANKQPDRLAPLINSTKAGPYVKCAAIKAIFAQYEINEITETLLKELISLWIDNACKIDTMENSHVLSELANLCIDYKFNDFQQLFLSLVQQNKLDIEFISNKEIEKWQGYGYSEGIKSGFIKTNINVIEELSNWACYRDTPKDIDEDKYTSLVDSLIEDAEYENYFYDEPETYIREEAKIGRNDPCPCGSGKKYKKCCV